MPALAPTSTRCTGRAQRCPTAHSAIRSPAERFTTLVCTSRVRISSASSSRYALRSPAARARHRGIGGGRAVQRRVVAAEWVCCPAEQQVVDRAEQQERRLLPGPPLHEEIKDGRSPATVRHSDRYSADDTKIESPAAKCSASRLVSATSAMVSTPAAGPTKRPWPRGVLRVDGTQRRRRGQTYSTISRSRLPKMLLKALLTFGDHVRSIPGSAPGRRARRRWLASGRVARAAVHVRTSCSRPVTGRT